MQALLEGGEKVEEDRAGGGEATTAGASGGVSTVVPTSITTAAAGATQGRTQTPSTTTTELATAEYIPAASEDGTLGVGGGGGVGMGVGGGAAGEEEEGRGGAGAAASTPGLKARPSSYSSSIGDSPRSKAIAAGAAAARGEHKTVPLMTPRGGSATMAALARGESLGRRRSSGGDGTHGLGPGEVLFTPRRNAKQVWCAVGFIGEGW